MGNHRLCLKGDKMTKIRLIASDLDGTLLQDGAQTPPEETCDLIRQLYQKGIRFMAASGRQYDNLERLFAPVKEDIWYLCQNGASACVGGSVLFQEMMKKETADRLVDEVMIRPDVEIMVDDFACCYVDERSDAFYHLVKDVVGMHAEKVSDLHAHTGHCSKISLYEEPGLYDIEYWQNTYGDDFTVVTGGAQWLDMMAKDINKGTALKQMLNHVDIPAGEIAVLGDNLNDLEMMRLAGLALTVPNGVPEVQEAAHRTVRSVISFMKEVLEGRDQIEDWKGDGR